MSIGTKADRFCGRGFPSDEAQEVLETVVVLRVPGQEAAVGHGDQQAGQEGQEGRDGEEDQQGPAEAGVGRLEQGQEDQDRGQEEQGQEVPGVAPEDARHLRVRGDHDQGQDQGQEHQAPGLLGPEKRADPPRP